MNWAKLLYVICMVESSGNPNVEDGDGGLAVGMYQIHQQYVFDVNRIYNTSYTHDDCRDRSTAELIVIKYLRYWGARYQLNTGKEPTFEDYCRMNNGGCHFYKDRSETDYYWSKCKRFL